MKTINHNPEPNDAAIRRSIKPVISYPIDNLPNFDEDFYKTARKEMNLIAVSYTHLTLPTNREV